RPDAAARQQPPAPPARPEFSSRVMAVQQALNRLGYGPLAADGLMGPGTRAAVERFQKGRGLPVTGEPGPRTLKALSAAAGVTLP
ncbi:peptidoglycan-binding protein, partial [Camelimonas abortus]